MAPGSDGSTVTRMAITSIDDLRDAAARELGGSAWIEVTQEAVDAFAAVTGDHQWIHTDPEQARETPFGGTIAHGFYVLSLAPRLLPELLPLDSFRFAINYGLGRVRFPAPLPVGDAVRLRARLDRVQAVAGGANLVTTLTFERAGGGKPVCVAEFIVRVYD
jgi:acyl dehydratase